MRGRPWSGGASAIGRRWLAALGGARRCSAVLGGARRCSAVAGGARRWLAVPRRCSATVVVGGARGRVLLICSALSGVVVGGGLCVVLGGRRRRSGRRWGLPGSGGGLAVKLTSNTQPYTPLTPTHGSALTRLVQWGQRAGISFSIFVGISCTLYPYRGTNYGTLLGTMVTWFLHTSHGFILYL